MGLRAGRYRDCRPRKFFEALTDELLAFAEVKFDLDRKQPDGATTRDHLEKVQRLTGEVPEQLARAEGNPLPELLEYLWIWYGSAASSRRAGPRGEPLPLDYRDIGEWARFNLVDLALWEKHAFMRLEGLYFESIKRWMTSQVSASK